MICALLLAASQAPDSAQLEVSEPDIIVTGERLPRSTYETASSVEVYDEARIDSEAAPDRVDQLLQSVPNVQLGSGGEGPTIRGQDSTGVVRDLSAFLSGTRPRTTITIDGRSASYYELAFGLTSLWDVERVEIYRSPQTTTQGRNSIGGAIFVETEQPSLDWEGRIRAIAGGASTEQLSAVLSGPLVEGQVAMRASGDIRRSRTSSEIAKITPGIDSNRDNSETFRVKLLARPTSLPDATLDLTYAHVRSQMPQIEGIEQPYKKRQNPTANYGIFAVTADSLTSRFSYQPSDDFEARTTLSLGWADVQRHAPPGLGVADIQNDDISIEPVFSWRFGQGMRVTGGLNYTHSKLNQTINLTAFPQVKGSGVFVDRQDSLGLFGESSFEIFPTLRFSAGLRYQRDRQVREGALVGAVIDLPLTFDRTFTAWLPKLSIAWDISPEVRSGVLVQRAANPGGVNLNFNRVRVETFEDEHLWDFEVYTRARLDGGRLEVSANAFLYEMFDAQRSQLVAFPLPNGQVDTTAYISNAPRAWTRGLEVEANWRPSPRLQLRGAVGLLDTKITRAILLTDPMLGKQFQRSPHFSGSASAVWDPVEGLTLSGHLRHNTTYFSDDLETTSRRISGSTTVDARADWAQGNVTIFGYARNLFDEYHLTYRFGPPSFIATAGDPREMGVGIEASF